MNTVFNVTFLIPVASLEAATTCVPTTTRIGICMDDGAVFQVNTIYRILFLKQAKQPFCIAVSNKVSTALLQDTMLALFNHPQYIIREKKPAVILIHEAPDTNLSIMEAFQEKVQAQGWAGVQWLNFFKTPYGIQRDKVVSLAVESVAEVETFFSVNLFADISAIADTHFIIQVDDVQLIPFIQKEFVKMEEALIEKNPNVYDLYMQLLRTTTALRATKEQLQFSNQQLDRLKQYNAILKSEKQTRRILEFYHSEYEVLPLWYKRVGHIIKVLTGKRSFKSLFDDAAKKENR